MPVIAERAAETVTGLKRPTPFFFCAAAVRFPPAFAALLLCWPLARLPPRKRTFLAFFFLRFFFFAGFLAAFFAGFFFFAAVCVVRARLLVIARFTTVVSVSTTASSNTILRESNALPLSQNGYGLAV